MTKPRKRGPEWTPGSELAKAIAEDGYNPRMAPAPNARARPDDEDMPTVALQWIGLVEWHTYRSAWAVVYETWEVGYDRVYKWVKARPEYLDALHAALGRRIARLERQRVKALDLPGPEGDRALRMAEWELGKVAREDYGDRSKVEQELTVKAPPEGDTPEALAEDALALLTDEQLAEVLKRRGKA